MSRRHLSKVEFGGVAATAEFAPDLSSWPNMPERVSEIKRYSCSSSSSSTSSMTGRRRRMLPPCPGSADLPRATKPIRSVDRKPYLNVENEDPRFLSESYGDHGGYTTTVIQDPYGTRAAPTGRERTRSSSETVDVGQLRTERRYDGTNRLSLTPEPYRKYSDNQLSHRKLSYRIDQFRKYSDESYLSPNYRPYVIQDDPCMQCA